MYVTVLTFDDEGFIIETTNLQVDATSRAEKLFESIGLMAYDDTIEPFTYLYRYSLAIDNVDYILPYNLVFGCNNGYYSLNVYEVNDDSFGMQNFILELTS